MLAALKLIANDRRTNGSHHFLVCIVQVQAVPCPKVPCDPPLKTRFPRTGIDHVQDTDN